MLGSEKLYYWRIRYVAKSQKSGNTLCLDVFNIGPEVGNQNTL
jgi:hypothetical protein